eukprot:363066-Chlamydomonas_euryale.AAC.5
MAPTTLSTPSLLPGCVTASPRKSVNDSTKPMKLVATAPPLNASMSGPLTGVAARSPLRGSSALPLATLAAGPGAAPNTAYSHSRNISNGPSTPSTIACCTFVRSPPNRWTTTGTTFWYTKASATTGSAGTTAGQFASARRAGSALPLPMASRPCGAERRGIRVS